MSYLWSPNFRFPSPFSQILTLYSWCSGNKMNWRISIPKVLLEKDLTCILQDPWEWKSGQCRLWRTGVPCSALAVARFWQAVALGTIWGSQVVLKDSLCCTAANSLCWGQREGLGTQPRIHRRQKWMIRGQGLALGESAPRLVIKKWLILSGQLCST